jgi:hypothetical protein
MTAQLGKRSASVLFANIDLLNPNLAQPTIANYSQDN